MCTTINETSPVVGSAKGARGWFRLGAANVGYDHPAHASEEHAVLLDFVDVDPQGQRVAVELSRESARHLAATILAAVEQADTYEAIAQSA